MEILRNDIQWPVNYLRGLINYPHIHERKVFINMCLYYGDFLAVKRHNRHITWCSYFNISGMPICTPLIANNKVDYSYTNVVDYDEFSDKQKELMQCLYDAYTDIDKIIQDFGWDKAKEFITDICNIVGQPKVSPEHMFYYAHVAKEKHDRKRFKALFEQDKQDRIAEYETRYIDPEFEEECVYRGNKYTSR